MVISSPHLQRVATAQLGQGKGMVLLMREEDLLPLQAGGPAQWQLTPLNMIFDGTSQTVDFQLNSLLNRPGQERRYYRFQTELTEDTSELDNSDPDNLQRLKAWDVILSNASKNKWIFSNSMVSYNLRASQGSSASHPY